MTESLSETDQTPMPDEQPTARDDARADEEKPLFEPGESCWRTAHAKRASVLVDGSNYFAALRAALLKAERSVYIIGWDIDSRMRLHGAEGVPDDGAPATLAAFLTHLVHQRPELQVHLNLWDYSVVYALEREPLPVLNLDWTTPERIKVCLDDVLPLGAAHHQKIVVIDDSIAFCGGLDLTIRRWDTPEHEPDNPARVDPAGEPYDPFHDIQMVVDGEAALALAELARKRWEEAACENSLSIEQGGDRWPDQLEPEFRDVEIAISRTVPTLGAEPGIREVEELYHRAIARAERAIYMENQFFTAESVCDSLIARLKEKPDLEVVLVAPKDHWGWLESQSMKAGRIRFMQRLRDADVADRVRLVFACLDGDSPEMPAVMIHAKLMIVDDRFLRVGSSNVNNRSMGVDTECDLALEAENEQTRAAIMALQARLLGEHLGRDPDEVREALADGKGLFEVLDELGGERRRLEPINDPDAVESSISRVVTTLADPERPAEAETFIGDMFGGRPASRWVGQVIKLVLAVLVIIGLALAWRFTPLSEWVDPNALQPVFESLAESVWAPVVLPLVYVAASLIVFPVTLLILLTGLVFGPLLGLAYALGGSLLAAAATYWIGMAAGRKGLRNLMGVRLNRISRRLGESGILSVAAIRMVPIAPFTLINLAAGATHIQFRDFILGTLIGMAPGIVLVTAMGYQISELLRDLDTLDVLLLAGIALLWLGVSIGLQVLVTRWRKRRAG